MEIIDTTVGDVTRNCKNYLTDGGDRLVIGGTLEVLDTATIVGLQSGYATEQTAGSVYQAMNQVESAATTIADLKSDFNALLQKLKNAGMMAADQPGSM
ncbi:MAG: head fiber protein [Christensenella sp.]|nr:head fiber protein [Christensenella sp.]